MTKQEILERAIKKAIDGGWKMPPLEHAVLTPVFVARNYGKTIAVRNWLNGMIFNHDFAKALWPKHDWNNETTFCNRCGVSMASTAGYSKTDCFYELLQQMVIADDPIKYLGENI